MMNDPIVVWPPGTFYVDCGTYGNYYDCGYDYVFHQLKDQLDHLS